MQGGLASTGDTDLHLSTWEKEIDPTEDKFSFSPKIELNAKESNKLSDECSQSVSKESSLLLNVISLSAPCLRSGGQVKHKQGYGIWNSAKHHAHAAAGFSVKAADRNANVSAGQSLQGEVISFIRPTDTAGKNRQAFGHRKPFLYRPEEGLVFLKMSGFSNYIGSSNKRYNLSLQTMPHLTVFEYHGCNSNTVTFWLYWFAAQTSAFVLTGINSLDREQATVF